MNTTNSQSKQTLVFDIKPDGSFKAIYDDALLPLIEGQEVEIKRASHVEPAVGGGWCIDLQPVGSYALRGRAFKTRAEALAAEREWLLENYL